MIISYELSIGLSVLTMVVMSGAMDIQTIVEGQANGWNIFKGHIPAIMAFVIYLIAGNAEANRGPFDLAEAEQELTAGYHTEYSGMHFRLLLSGRILEPVHYCRYRHYTVLGRLDALAHCRTRRTEHGDGLHPRIHLVHWKDLLHRLPAHVDSLDLPPFAYRPGTDTGMEIPDAALAGRIVINDRMQSIWSDILIKNF